MPASNYLAQRLAALLTLLLLSSCGNELAGLTDSELQDRAHQCRSGRDQTPGQAISCDNFRRECQRRRDEGRYVC